MNRARFILFFAISVILGALIGLSDSFSGTYQWAIVLISISIVPISLLYGTIFRNWRTGIYGLMAFMPFSGLPGILLYEYIGSGRATLIKDILFVIPAYLSFLWWYRGRNVAIRMNFVGKRVIFTLMILIGELVVIQCFNPQLLNLLVALIGLKVWLFYIPLFVLGYYLIDSKMQLMRLAKMTLALGITPVLYGITQAILIYTGNTHLAYALHGPAAEGATQMFARFELSSGAWLMRVPGLFTFPLQYSSFLFVVLASGYALWSGSEIGRAHRIWYIIALTAVVIAAITSGARIMYALLPAYFVVTLLLERQFKSIWKPSLALICLIPIGLGALVWLLGSPLRDFLDFAVSIIALYVIPESELGFIRQFEQGLQLTWFGMGTGMDTGPARYAFGSAARSSYINEAYNLSVESFHGKVIIELGIPGLIIIAFLFGALLVSGYRQLRQVQDPSLRTFGVGLLSLLAVIVIYLLKGAVLDYDPLNVYFWLFAGILMRLPDLETNSILRSPYRILWSRNGLRMPK